MRNREAGFSIIEAMVATTLALLVLSTSAGLFTRALEITDTARLSGSTNHGMQAAMTMMVRDFMQAGQGIPRGGFPIPFGGPTQPIVRPGPPGSALTFNPTWVTFPAVATGGAIGPTVLGVTTDMVTVLYADATLQLNQFPLAAIAPTGGSMTVNAGTPIGGVNGVRIGDLILFTNALGTAVQYVTAVNGQIVTFASPDPFNFNQRVAPQGSIMALQSSPGVFPPTTATRIWMVSYYIDATTDPNLPRLVRRVNFGTPLAIALGAENLQFTYDLVNGTTNPTNVETPAAPNSPHQIRKANLFLSARSLDKSLPTNQYLRNSMGLSVGLRSLTFVDRYK